MAAGCPASVHGAEAAPPQTFGSSSLHQPAYPTPGFEHPAWRRYKWNTLKSDDIVIYVPCGPVPPLPVQEEEVAGGGNSGSTHTRLTQPCPPL